MFFVVSLTLLLVTGLAAVAPEKAELIPLLEYKSELARDQQAFIHLIPEAVIVYFKAVELKRLPFEEMKSSPAGPLRRSRIVGWHPAAERPNVIADLEPPQPLEYDDLMLRVDDMPESYVVWLEDGTLLAVTADPALRTPSEVLKAVSVKAGSISPKTGCGRSEIKRRVLIRVAKDVAREFYWLLREKMGVIY